MAANEPGQPPLVAAQPNGHGRVPLPTPSRALAIGAHPDDIEFGCGATLAGWAARGCEVHVLVCTDGSKGTWDATADASFLAAEREREQRAAANELVGSQLGSVTFLRRVDGELTADRSTVAEVALAIRRAQPDVVLGHDPWKRYRLHPDHRAAGQIVCDAVVAARDPHFFPEHLREHGLAHHRPAALLLWEADEPNYAHDITDGIPAKLAALRQHVSQFESTMGAATADQLDAFDARIRARLAELGGQFGVDHAEVFHLMSDL
jgi:LmbE family N-acetylglucosaminyl deacetylase